ncbi:MAG TPA: hypothetical protein VLV76_18775 [Candidatus Acidoferrum sp.]|nr:hypothetical protein [Candidatus Acidoferrum sp.]
MPRRESRATGRRPLGASVEITQSGRGGSITYREGANAAGFDWEFGASPAIALIFGPTAEVWDRRYPWAAGRQAEICDFVASEAVRQQANGAHFEVDLESGTISVLERTHAKSRPEGARATHTAAYARFIAGIVPPWQEWREDQAYDVAAIAEMTAAERAEIAGLLAERPPTWREVAALSVIDADAARRAIEAAANNHLSIDVRLAAAEVMHDQGRLPDLDALLAREIRNLHRPADGLTRALRLAERHPSDTVKQALLWASYNATECAPRCAGLLLSLTGAGKPPFSAEVERLLRKLDLHNSYFDRKAAFDELCRLVGMELDPGAAS